MIAFWLLYQILIEYTKWAARNNRLRITYIANISKVILQIAYIIEHFYHQEDTITLQLLVLKNEYFKVKNVVRGVIFALLMTVQWLLIINVFRLWGPFRIFVEVFRKTI